MGKKKSRVHSGERTGSPAKPEKVRRFNPSLTISIVGVLLSAAGILLAWFFNYSDPVPGILLRQFSVYDDLKTGFPFVGLQVEFVNPGKSPMTLRTFTIDGFYRPSQRWISSGFYRMTAKDGEEEYPTDAENIFLDGRAAKTIHLTFENFGLDLKEQEAFAREIQKSAYSGGEPTIFTHITLHVVDTKGIIHKSSDFFAITPTRKVYSYTASKNEAMREGRDSDGFFAFDPTLPSPYVKMERLTRPSREGLLREPKVK